MCDSCSSRCLNFVNLGAKSTVTLDHHAQVTPVDVVLTRYSDDDFHVPRKRPSTTSSKRLSARLLPGFSNQIQEHVEPPTVEESDEVVQLRAQILQLDDSKNKLIAKHQQGVMDLRSYYDNELEEKNAEIQRLENEIQSTNSPRIDNTELIHTREQLKEIDSKLVKRDHEIVVLNTSINALEQEVSKYKQIATSLESQLERLKDTKPDPKQELERVQQLERMRSMSEEMNNMTLVIKQLSRDKELLTSDNIRLTNQLEDMQRELRQKQSVQSTSLSERDMELAVLKYANKYFSPTYGQYQEPRYETYSPRSYEPTTITYSPIEPLRSQSPPPQEPSPKQARTTNIQSSAPFATDQSWVDSTDTTQRIQDQLIELSLEKNDLDGEYQKLMSSNLKTIKSRKRKMEIEQRLESIAKQGSDLRTELKKQLATIR